VSRLAPGWGRIALITLAAIAALLLARILYPFAGALLLAAVLAAALGPRFERLAVRLGGRRQVAAVVFTIAVTLLVVAPLLWVLGLGLKEGIEGSAILNDMLQRESPQGLVERLPAMLQPYAIKILGWLPHGGERLQGMMVGLAGHLAHWIAAMTISLMQEFLMLIAFYFLLLDGHALVLWLADVLPLRAVHVLELVREFRDVSVAVMYSTVVTSLVQSAAALLSYLLLDVPNASFLTILTFFFGLVPMLGASIVPFFVSIWLFFQGHEGPGLFLLLWSVLIVGLMDNVLKPLLMKGRIRLHEAVIFFALLGGLAVFGPVGVLIGPLIVSLHVATVRIYRRDYSVNAREDILVSPVTEAPASGGSESSTPANGSHGEPRIFPKTQ
jgi:predicted PurR-regulated permease PerM